MINTKLLVDTKPSAEVQPGNIYLKKVVRRDRKESLLKNYLRECEQPIWDKDGEFLLNKNELNAFKFIELEVSPICDYA